MSMLEIAPILFYIGAMVVILYISLYSRRDSQSSWIFPCLLGAFFFVFSIITLLQDGLSGFWFNHTTNLSGNQVWFDLLFAVSISFFLIAPRARAVGMPLLPWGIAVIMTACIALLPMLGRLLWLEHQKSA